LWLAEGNTLLAAELLDIALVLLGRGGEENIARIRQNVDRSIVFSGTSATFLFLALECFFDVPFEGGQEECLKQARNIWEKIEDIGEEIASWFEPDPPRGGTRGGGTTTVGGGSDMPVDVEGPGLIGLIGTEPIPGPGRFGEPDDEGDVSNPSPDQNASDPVQLGFNYTWLNCIEDFVQTKLKPGHDLAGKQLGAAHRAMKKTGEASAKVNSALRSFFGDKAIEPDNRFTIYQRFIQLRIALEASYAYECVVNLGDGRCKSGKQAETLHAGGDIALCTDQLSGYGVPGMAGLTIHENVHRIGFFGESSDPSQNTHFTENPPIRARHTTGLCANTGGQEGRPIALLVNADSYACFAAWAHAEGY
jgi:hypothetical protein